MTERTEAEDVAADEAGLDQDDPRYEQAILGREIQNWIEHDPIGVYVISKAREEVEECKEKLLSETDLDKIRDLQNRAAICNRIGQWLGEAIRAGHHAVDSLQTERDLNNDQ